MSKTDKNLEVEAKKSDVEEIKLTFEDGTEKILTKGAVIDASEGFSNEFSMSFVGMKGEDIKEFFNYLLHVCIEVLNIGE